MGVRGLVVAVSAAVFGVAGCTSSGPASNPTAPRSTLRQQLWTIASKAADNAHSGAASASAVRTTYRDALRFMTGHDAGGSKRAVWLVQVRGTQPFSCECDVVASRSGDDTANYMLIVADGSALRMISGADLYAEMQPIEALGQTIDLHP